MLIDTQMANFKNINILVSWCSRVKCTNYYCINTHTRIDYMMNIINLKM